MSRLRRFSGLGSTILLASLAFAQLAPEAGAQYSALQPVRTAQADNMAPPRPQDPDPLLDLPPVAKVPDTLIGGTIAKLDRVRDRLILKPFGGGKLEIAFDPRTKIVRGEQAATARDLLPGERIHLETVNQGTRIFAKVIHLGMEAMQGEAHGQVVSYDAGSGNISVNDELSAQPVQFRIDKSTNLTGGALVVGSLVDVHFLPNGDRAAAREVKVLAAPGSMFTFLGQITYLDLSSHSLVISSSTDDRKYAIKFDPQRVDAWARLHEGANVSVKARFDGANYVAEDVAVIAAVSR